MITFAFVQLPCGCIADASVVRVYCTAIIECPWCSATFDRAEFHTWLKAENAEGRKMVSLARSPLPLVRFGTLLLEVAGACKHCQMPLMREKSITFHCAVRDEDVKRVPN